MTDTNDDAFKDARLERFVSRAEARRALVLSHRIDAEFICQPVLESVERVKEKN